MRDIGKNIRDLRMQKNMTQDELAENLFVTRQTVSNYETGKSRPDIDMLMKIAEVLGTDISKILYGTQQPVEKKKLRRLVIGSILTTVVGIIWAILSHYFADIRYRYLVAGPAFVEYFFLCPFFFLLLGWTTAHLLGMALKKDPLKTKWADYLRYGLLLFLLLYFFIVLSYLIPYLIGEYQFMHDTGDRSLRDYLHIPAYAESFFMDILFSLFFAKFTPEITAFTLPIGMLLWLFGFPNFCPSGKNI